LSFVDANASASLYGVRFAADNDAAVEQAGVYGNVSAVSVAAKNGLALPNLDLTPPPPGNNSLASYNNYVRYRGGTP
jgi:hypothetical protein